MQISWSKICTFLHVFARKKENPWRCDQGFSVLEDGGGAENRRLGAEPSSWDFAMRVQTECKRGRKKSPRKPEPAGVRRR